MNNDIKNFCRLVVEINELNKQLDKERENFYDGGKSFEECNSLLIDDINQKEIEFLNSFKNVSNTQDNNGFDGKLPSLTSILYD